MQLFLHFYEVRASAKSRFFGGTFRHRAVARSPRDEGCPVSAMCHGLAPERHFGDEVQIQMGVVWLKALGLPHRVAAGPGPGHPPRGQAIPARIISPP